jgi:hypothetical protein
VGGESEPDIFSLPCGRLLSDEPAIPPRADRLPRGRLRTPSMEQRAATSAGAARGVRTCRPRRHALGRTVARHGRRHHVLGNCRSLESAPPGKHRDRSIGTDCSRSPWTHPHSAQHPPRTQARRARTSPSTTWWRPVSPCSARTDASYVRGRLIITRWAPGASGIDTPLESGELTRRQWRGPRSSFATIDVSHL